MNLRTACALALALSLHALLLWAAGPAAGKAEEPLGNGPGDGSEPMDSLGKTVAADTSQSPVIRLATRGPADTAELAANDTSASSGGDDSYLGRVRAALNARAAKMAPRLQQRGVAVIRFEILADGQTSAAQLVSSSGSTVLDAAALSLLEQGSPLPPPSQPMQLRVPVEFRME